MVVMIKGYDGCHAKQGLVSVMLKGYDGCQAKQDLVYVMLKGSDFIILKRHDGCHAKRDLISGKWTWLSSPDPTIKQIEITCLIVTFMNWDGFRYLTKFEVPSTGIEAANSYILLLLNS